MKKKVKYSLSNDLIQERIFDLEHHSPIQQGERINEVTEEIGLLNPNFNGIANIYSFEDINEEEQ